MQEGLRKNAMHKLDQSKNRKVSEKDIKPE